MTIKPRRLKPIPDRVLNHGGWKLPRGTVQSKPIDIVELTKLVLWANKNASAMNVGEVDRTQPLMNTSDFEGPYYLYPHWMRPLKNECVIADGDRIWVLGVPGWSYYANPKLLLGHNSFVTSVIDKPATVQWAGELIYRRIAPVKPPPKWITKGLADDYEIRVMSCAEIEKQREVEIGIHQFNDKTALGKSHWARRSPMERDGSFSAPREAATHSKHSGPLSQPQSVNIREGNDHPI